MTRKTEIRLVWIIAGSLAAWYGVVVPVGGGFNVTLQVATELKELTLGIKNYQVEYGHYPVPPTASNSAADQRFESTGRLLACLLGKNVEGLNPREIAFIEPPMARDGRRGLIGGGAPGQDRLVDFWGRPYVIWIDTNHDNKIANPDTRSFSPLVSTGAPAMLDAGALAYSLGPDGIEGTRDDIVSWRGIILSRAEHLWKLAARAGWVAMALIVMGLVQVVLLIRDPAVWLMRRKERGNFE